MLVTDIKTNETAPFSFPREADLQTLCRTEGPCASVFLGPHAAGSGSRASGDILRGMLPQMTETLARQGMPAAMMDALQELCDLPAMNAGHRDSFCLFRSPDSLYCFSIRGMVEPAWHIEERFVVTPVLAHLDSPKVFLLLALAEKHIRLLHCHDGEVETLPIPYGVPESAMEFSRNDRGSDRGENHAYGVRFGSYDPREKEKGGQFRREFMKEIDKGLQPVYRQYGLPLVLAGVDSETSAYAAISGYGDLVEETVQMSPDGGATSVELAKSGGEVVERWNSPARKQALGELAKAGKTRRSVKESEILAAARAGKVHHLFLPRGKNVVDGVNAAAVEVLRHRGVVWLIEPEQMPDDGALAAVYRYAGGKHGR